MKSIIKVNDEHISLDREKAIVSMILAYRAMIVCGWVPTNSLKEKSALIAETNDLLQLFENMDGWDEVNNPPHYEVTRDPITNKPIGYKECSENH